jgi:hypothetical protein
MAGLMSPGYLESRLAWVGLAVAVVILAGLIYAPHKAKKSAVLAGRLGVLVNAGPPPHVIADAPAARRALVGGLGLVISEFRLIGSGRAFLLTAAIVAAITAAAPDFRHTGSAAALLLLLFALSAHAGRTEARGLIAMAKLTAFAPMARRSAFIVAGASWSTLLSLPAAPQGVMDVLPLAAGTGAGAALVAIILATLTGSSFAARLVLLVLWYGYVSL